MSALPSVAAARLADLELGPSSALVRAAVDWTGAPLLATAPAGAAAAAEQRRAGRVQPYPLTLSRLVEGRWQELPAVETAHPAPHVQTLPGGLVLVVGRTSRRAPDGRAEPNATVYGPDGAERASFVAGDGVEDVQATAAGEIWVSYFDDGTMGDYGRFGWGRLSPEVWVEPVGGAGLVRFDLSGRRLYEYAPPAGLERAADCFALNVDAEGSAWLSYHPGFPLVRVRGDAATAWATGWRAVDAFAVDGGRVLQYERFGDRRHSCRVGRLEGGAVVETATVEPALADGLRLGDAAWVLGRAGALHAVAGGAWYRLGVPAAGA